MNKNVLMAEDVGNKDLVQQQLSLQNQTAITGDIATEAQAVEIAKNALKGLFDVDVAEIKVEKPFTQFITVGDSIYDVPV